ncbi:MAG: hypothetical protein IPM49_08645 [Flavobacteriales bacterium]|nr:hypothetical protein [Flavobacteriales bacterium]
MSTYGTQVNDAETRTRSLNGQLAFRHKAPKEGKGGLVDLTHCNRWDRDGESRFRRFIADGGPGTTTPTHPGTKPGRIVLRPVVRFSSTWWTR